MPVAIVDDKSPHCLPFILERLRIHREAYAARQQPPPPFFLGLNGVQGAGKTTLASLIPDGQSTLFRWAAEAINRFRPTKNPLITHLGDDRETEFYVSTLCSTLTAPPYNLPTVVLSIDDLYLRHDEQEVLAKAHPSNPLVQHRGEPSTHDVSTGVRLFEALAARQSAKIPSYDKSQFNGAGDRRPENEWPIVNAPHEQPIEVIVFEGWCVGFRALSDGEVEAKWQSAKAAAESPNVPYDGQLGKLKLSDVLFVNNALRGYDALTDKLHAFVHIDAEDTQYVYHWRQEQEAAMRAAKGTGMTNEQVTNFVNGYYPAYELYTDVLRNGIYGGGQDKQLRLVIGKDRKVKGVSRI